MNIMLHRHDAGTEEEGMFGTLYVAGMEFCKTVEQEWSGNKPFKSAVPDGVYDLVPHDSQKYGNVYALVNPRLGVFHLPEHIPKDYKGSGPRYACLIHAANFARQLQGCIAPGKVIADIGGEKGVTSSRITLARLMNILGHDVDGHTITIGGAEE